MTLTERIRAAEAARLAARLADIDRAAAALPAGYVGNCSCCRSRQQAAASSRAARRSLWQTPAAVKLSRAAEWTAAVLGTLAVMLLSSVNF
jgi:hypothetical protein